MPRIRLAENVELVLLILWELFVKILQKSPHVGCHTVFIVRAKASGKSNTGRLVDPHHIRLVVPAVRVDFRGTPGIYCAGSILHKHGQL